MISDNKDIHEHYSRVTKHRDDCYQYSKKEELKINTNNKRRKKTGLKNDNVHDN